MHVNCFSEEKCNEHERNLKRLSERNARLEEEKQSAAEAIRQLEEANRSTKR